MKSNLKNLLLSVCAVLFLSATGFAQKYEIHPYVGRTAPAKWADAHRLKSVSIVGVKAAAFVDNTSQVELELQYMPHFEFQGTDPKTRALVWGVNASRNIYIPNEQTFVPFFSFGVGGTTARLESPGSFTTVFPDRSVTIDNNDTFFTFNYGGGVKALNLSGPAGLRLNVLGRTIPNFFNRGNTWVEVTGGLIFTWGEK